MNIRIALSLGANLGRIEATFNTAVSGLARAGLTDIRKSSLFRNPAQGCAPGTPDFINAAVSGQWPASVEALHEVCKKLEEAAGRPINHEHYASRTLDLDIILFGEQVIHSDTLDIPHKQALKRLFVLVPLAEIAEDWNFPGQPQNVAALLALHRETEAYRRFVQERMDWR